MLICLPKLSHAISEKKLATKSEVYFTIFIMALGQYLSFEKFYPSENTPVAMYTVLTMCYYSGFSNFFYILRKSILGIKNSILILHFISALYSIMFILKGCNVPHPFSPVLTNIFLLLLFSTWPNKPFLFKNIFNELSGDNALSRELLSQKPKASTQCKG